ncbi:hypothetical protein WJX73_006483 [Symbiochloris irregularis]|uniref:TauD/TfdA-like domain-containing protein n=1 Tax=Symbiochloris irregularis TaxID=706552 RepID=A0AAW1NX79_9CHLO
MPATCFFQERQPSFAKSYSVKGERSQTGAPEAVPGPPSGFLQCLEAPQGASATNCGQQARELIDSNLGQQGAILLQKLPVVGDEAEAGHFVEALGYNVIKYEPFGGQRKKIGKLDAATNIPGARILPVHNEMSYNVRASKKIMLLCLRAADKGGENLVARNAEVTSYIPPEILQKFDDRGGIRYTRRYGKEDKPPEQGDGGLRPGTISWKTRTGADTIDAAAQYWRDLGFTEVSHDAEGTLTVVNTQPACLQGPSGEPLFFNIASKASVSHPSSPFSITYGDGSKIEDETIDALNEAEWRAS